MRFFLLVFVCFGLVFNQADAQKKTTVKKEKGTETKMELKTKDTKLAYIIGRNIGMNMIQQMKGDSVFLNWEYLIFGIKEGINGNPPLITESEMQEIMMAFQQELKVKQTEKQAKQAAEMKKIGEESKKEGEAFLAENKKKEGVVTLPSGLQYKVLVEGKGPSPKVTDTVTTHYRGSLINGKEFDNSYVRNTPATFAVNAVIPGWIEALQLMKVGSKWQIYIPGPLGYGEQGGGSDIPPNATLIFDIELLSINGVK
jgi:FKBP-type peptidyl-prolyl cis-trans isomerase FklB